MIDIVAPETGDATPENLLLKYANRPEGVRLAMAAYNAGPGAVDRYGRHIAPSVLTPASAA